MNDFKLIKVKKQDGRIDIVLNNPPLNILTIAMMEEITVAVKDAASDSELRALVFRQEGKHFSAGADVSEHLAEKVNDMIAAFGHMFEAICQVDAVVIALVDGSALGGGCELATFCDIVIASDRSKFGQPEIQLGVLPPVAAVIFPYLIGRDRALELIISGRIIKADEAERMGLINRVYPADEFAEKAEEYIGGYTRLSASTIAITKKLIDKVLYVPAREGLRLADEAYFNELMTTADAHEGLASFLEKRKPVWKHK